MDAKRIGDSKSAISDVMLPSQANPAGNVHGGEIMKMMDVAASVVAMRHARSNVVTLRVDELIFHHPIYVGQLVTCEAELVYVGNSSMEIQVCVKVDDTQVDSPQKIAQTAFFTFVALDANGKSVTVPRLLLETEEEKRRFEEGRLRHQIRKNA